MLIKFSDVQIGDEIVIPSNPKLKYLKVLSKTAKGSYKCSTYRGDQISFFNPNHINKDVFICNSNVEEHNSTFYLREDNNYTDLWLVKREN